jgi:hypothetical protein
MNLRLEVPITAVAIAGTPFGAVGGSIVMVGVAEYPTPVFGAMMIEATDVGANIAVIMALLGVFTVTVGTPVKSRTVVPVSAILAIGVGSSVAANVAVPLLAVIIGSATKRPRFLGSRITPAIGAGVNRAVAVGAAVHVIPTGVIVTVGVVE